VHQQLDSHLAEEVAKAVVFALPAPLGARLALPRSEIGIDPIRHVRHLFPLRAAYSRRVLTP
jgi:hypothetical protein